MCQGQCQLPPTAAWPEARGLSWGGWGEGHVQGCGRRVSLETVPALSCQLHMSACSFDLTTSHPTSSHITQPHRCKHIYTVICSRHSHRHTNTGRWPLTRTTHAAGTLRLSRPACRPLRRSHALPPYGHTVQSCDGHSWHAPRSLWAQLKGKDFLEGLGLLWN